MTKIYLVHCTTSEQGEYKDVINMVFSNLKAAKNFIEWKRKQIEREGVKITDFKILNGFHAWYSQEETLISYYIDDKNIIKEWD